MTVNAMGQPTPLKTPARIAQCSEIISAMRDMLAKASAKASEKKRINKPFVSHGLANQKIRNAGGQQAVYAASEARYQSQLLAGI